VAQAHRRRVWRDRRRLLGPVRCPRLHFAPTTAPATHTACRRNNSQVNLVLSYAAVMPSALNLPARRSAHIAKASLSDTQAQLHAGSIPRDVPAARCKLLRLHLVWNAAAHGTSASRTCARRNWQTQAPVTDSVSRAKTLPARNYASHTSCVTQRLSHPVFTCCMSHRTSESGPPSDGQDPAGPLPISYTERAQVCTGKECHTPPF
jgi:hypothetical protein